MQKENTYTMYSYHYGTTFQLHVLCIIILVNEFILFICMNTLSIRCNIA